MILGNQKLFCSLKEPRLGEMTMLNQLKRELADLGNTERAQKLSGFFKTGKGQYGEGDVFLGIPVPAQRKLAKTYGKLPLPELQELLSSQIHEHRLTALLILIAQYRTADQAKKDEIYQFYLTNIEYVNNWDLVDISAPKIIGEHLRDRDTRILDKLANSTSVWERRIAILSTFTFIRNDEFTEALRISELLVHDAHDLIHKAVGWMLREIGKRDQAVEERFLQKYSAQMPRTMLRYAIEKFDDKKRQHYLIHKARHKQ
jgi:3-methyladenine DNA glycosylase AlkD